LPPPNLEILKTKSISFVNCTFKLHLAWLLPKTTLGGLTFNEFYLDFVKMKIRNTGCENPELNPYRELEEDRELYLKEVLDYCK
jgi:hypothetical protein